MSTFQDESTDCAICLEPLEGDVGAESLSSARRVLTLQCGHKWHYDCIVQQLQTAQSTRSNHNQRLIFTGCQCAKCGQICEHDELDHLTRATDVLRTKVDILLEEQLQLDAPQALKKVLEEGGRCQVNKENGLHVSNKPSAKDLLMNEARRKYAFYMCSHCKEPYFGGTIECADQFTLGEEDTVVPEQRLCTACAPQSQTVCHKPQEHGRYLIWKCRYCCLPSTHVCYGNVHFCDDCHVRNSKRVQELQLQQGNHSRQVKPPPLEAILCKGESCSFPKPSRDATCHSNGPSPTECEQVYSCAFCDSDGGQGRHAMHVIEQPGSDNLLVNPSGERGLDGWHQISRGISWSVEDSELPINATTTTNFVSSFIDCIMVQEVDLTRLLKPPRQWPGPVRVEVSARYMARTDCPSIFRMETLILLRRPGDGPIATPGRLTVLSREATPVLDAPPDYWDNARLELTIDPSRLQRGFTEDHKILLQVSVAGRDRRYWQGRFGSKVAAISVRILGSSDELDLILRPDTSQQLIEERSEASQRPRQRQNDQSARMATRGLRLAETSANPAREQNQNQDQRHRMLWDFFLPAVFFGILAWLTIDSNDYSNNV